MPTNSPINAIPYPIQADAPDVVAEMAASSGVIDSRLIPRFTNASARDAAITSPVAGQFAYLTQESLMTYYQGAAWRPLANAKQLVKGATESTTLVAPTYQDDDTVKFYVEANSVYEYELWTGVTNSGGIANAFTSKWSVPVGTTGVRNFIGEARNATSRDSHALTIRSWALTAEVATSGDGGLGGTVFGQENGIVRTSSTPGIMQYQWTKNSAAAGTTSLSGLGTILQVRKIR
jgi:hypothetical protein